MLRYLLSGIVTATFLWVSLASLVASRRAADRPLLLLAMSTGLIGISTCIPLFNTIVGGFGRQMEFWLFLWVGLLLLGGLGLTIFTTTLGGFKRLRDRGLSLWDIILLRYR